MLTFTVIFVLALSYFGKRIYSYHKFRTIQVNKIKTTSQNKTTNDSNQIEIFYDQVLDVEYVEPLHKPSDTYDEMRDENSSISDVALNGKQITDNQADENLSFNRESDIGLYITPCM